MNEFSQIDLDISEAFQKKQMDKVCSLYYEAANYFENKADIEAACFFYTQALVMALEENHDLKEKIIYKLEQRTSPYMDLRYSIVHMSHMR